VALAQPGQGEMILAFELQKSAGHVFDDCLHAVATEAMFDLFEDVAMSHNATVAAANSQPPSRSFRMHVICLQRSHGSGAGCVPLFEAYDIRRQGAQGRGVVTNPRAKRPNIKSGLTQHEDLHAARLQSLGRRRRDVAGNSSHWRRGDRCGGRSCPQCLWSALSISSP
jgi:hypothetical protein